MPTVVTRFIAARALSSQEVHVRRVLGTVVSMFGLSWWIVVPLTLAGLSASSLPKYIELYPRAQRVGTQSEWWKTVTLSTFNSLAAAVAAFLLGNLLRWVWW
jgi:ABC-type sulfate transport system permease component